MKCNQNLLNRYLKKTILVVYLVLCQYAFINAQTELKVSVNFKNETVGNVLREVEKQTGLNFVYNAEHIKRFNCFELFNDSSIETS